MSGLTNSILSVLLSWIRMLIANLWAMVTSEDGGALYQFLAANWLTVLIVLCIGGFATDRIIYVIRWRPHYVWLSRWKRFRRQKTETEHPQYAPQPEPEPPALVYTPYAPTNRNPAATRVYAPIQESEPVFEEEPLRWDEQAMWEQPAVH